MSLNWDTKRWSLKYTSRFGDDSIITTVHEELVLELAIH